MLIIFIYIECGCTRELELSSREKEFLNFKIKINTTSRTNEDGNSWSDLDSLGLFMINNEDYIVSNEKYVINIVNNEKSISGKEQFYPNGNTTFIGYYPYRKNISDHYPVSLTDQKSIPSIDLLYAKATGNKGSIPTELLFNHVLCRITFNLIKDEGYSDKINKITIKDIPAIAKVKLSDAIITGSYNPFYDIVNNDITMNFNKTNNRAIALIIPHTASSNNYQVEITVDKNKKYKLGFGENTIFEQGKNYSYNLYINDSIISLKRDETNVTTDSWKNNNLINNRFSTETILVTNTDSRYYLSKYETTNEQYMTFLNKRQIKNSNENNVDYNNIKVNILPKNISDFHYNSTSNQWNCVKGKEEYPVSCNWYGATLYATWIGGFLPTRDEWKFACKANSADDFSMWDLNSDDAISGDERELSTYACYSDNIERNTFRVGSFTSNYWGLFDMHGNIMEWCSDGKNGNKYVCGGSYLSTEKNCYSEHYELFSPDEDDKNHERGFRVAFNYQ